MPSVGVVKHGVRCSGGAGGVALVDEADAAESVAEAHLRQRDRRARAAEFVKRVVGDVEFLAVEKVYD